MNVVWERAARAADDNGFWPQFHQYPEFTLGFEGAILTIPPALLLLQLTPLYIWYYVVLPVTAAEEPLIWVKTGTNSALIVLQVVSAVFYSSPSCSTSLCLIASVVDCLAIFVLAVLMHFEHRRGVKSSPLPALYLFMTLLLDVTKARSYFLHSAAGLHSLAWISVAVAALKLVLLILGELQKRTELKGVSTGPEATRRFWGRGTFFTWLNSTLLLGFRNILAPEDLPNLDTSFASARLAAEFEPVWKKSDKTSPYRLLKATLSAQIWSFFAVVPPRLLHIGFTFAEPFLLRRIVQQITRDRDPDTVRGLIGSMALVHGGGTVARMWYKHMNNRLIVKTRGTLVSQILRKNFLLGPHEAKRSAASTLISTDVDCIVDTIPLIHETWASVIELGLSIYFLLTVISQSGLLVIFPAMISAAVSLHVGRRLAPTLKLWNGKTEKRVSVTSQVFSQLRGLKMIAAEMAVGDYVQSLRKEEVGISRSVRKLGTLTTAALSMSYAITPVVIMAGGLYWRGFTDGLDATKTFTVLAFVYLASQPMAAFLISWSTIVGLNDYFSRIQAYLLISERVDSREPILEQPDDKPLLNKKTPIHNIGHFPIQLANATIATPGGRALFTANVVFGRSTVTMMIGPTGAGKSTLLKALLGEANITRGSVFVQPQRIAFCDQEEWICNITIRNNIISESAYEEEWYRSVIEACLLDDIEEFPQGDQTLAGSRGSNLSGGQRQRVALARAVYSRAPIFLFDDSLSALDRLSSATILQRLVGQDGLLRSLGSTVVMSTQSVELLKNADRVLVIQPNGTVVVQAPDVAIKKYEGRGFLDDFSDDSEDISEGGSQDNSADRHYTPPLPTPKASTSLRQTADLALYKHYLKSFKPVLFLSWLLVLSLLAVSEKAPEVYIRLWVEKDPQNKALYVGYVLIGAVILATTVLWAWIYLIHLVPESAERLHRILLDSVTNATISFITYTDAGALLNRFSQDMRLVLRELPLTFFFVTYNLFGLSIVIAIIATSVQYAATIVPFQLTILYGIQLFYLRASRQMRLLDTEAESPMYAHLTECSEGVEHIRAFQWEERRLSKAWDILDKSQKLFYFRQCIQHWLGLVLDLLVTATGVFLVALALYQGSTTQASLGLGLLKVMQIGPDLLYFVEQWVGLEDSLAALSRIRAFEKETPREGTGAGRDGTSSVPENWPHEGHIRVDNVSANYSVKGTEYTALHELSVDIAPGTKVGLVGRTGSGKSSFLLTLLNFLDFSGSVVIDGIDITTIPRHILRSRITTISQEFMSLPSSVRNNLVPQEIMKAAGERTGDVELLNALEKVGLKRLVESRGGLDKPLEEVGLSGGEQQLLALARALVHHGRVKGKIIFMDEATSYIDYDSEAKLQQVTTEAFADCTVLTIAHRHHTLNNTTLLELSAGYLVAYG